MSLSKWMFRTNSSGFKKTHETFLELRETIPGFIGF